MTRNWEASSTDKLSTVSPSYVTCAQLDYLSWKPDLSMINMSLEMQETCHDQSS